MKVTNLDQTLKTTMDLEGVKDVFKQVPLSSKDGAPNFVFRVFSIKPGGHTPYHQHPFEHLNYVIEGKGVLVSENKKEHAIKKGDFALVLPDEIHQYKNKSDQNQLILICAVPKEYE